MLKIKRDNNQTDVLNRWPPFCQIWIVFTHLKLCVASAVSRQRRKTSSEWKLQYKNLGLEGLMYNGDIWKTEQELKCHMCDCCTSLPNDNVQETQNLPSKQRTYWSIAGSTLANMSRATLMLCQYWIWVLYFLWFRVFIMIQWLSKRMIIQNKQPFCYIYRHEMKILICNAQKISVSVQIGLHISGTYDWVCQ